MTGRFDFSRYPILETQRLLLREITPEDALALSVLLSDEETVKYLVDLPRQWTDPVGVLNIMNFIQQSYHEKTAMRWAITFKQNNILIGTCGFHRYDPANFRAEVGYDLYRAHWRQGIMEEAMRRLLAFCFEELDLHRIEAEVIEGNVASACLLAKLGFQQEGVWRERVYGRGKFHSLRQFGLLRQEYNIG
jgi:ribosomal-protein-alanine N-acetyltransferase